MVAECATTTPRCSVSVLGACAVQGIRSGAGGALGAGGLSEGAGEASLRSNLAVLPCSFASLHRKSTVEVDQPTFPAYDIRI